MVTFLGRVPVFFLVKILRYFRVFFFFFLKTGRTNIPVEFCSVSRAPRRGNRVVAFAPKTDERWKRLETLVYNETFSQ